MGCLLVLMLMVTAKGSIGPSNNSSFCTESKECLLFDVVCKTGEYEVRHYDPSRWVSTDAEAYFMGVGAAMAFRRLFKYISGANEEAVNIDMTAPVLVKIPEERNIPMKLLDRHNEIWYVAEGEPVCSVPQHPASES
ncbi:hypothetical protein Z043_122557 [Scleropages formosus]|uniref:Heme-binding protein 2-like n=1 Tax=Scleropages formosus TaxID=113540 RepID=A0A0P7WE38_SCLFO|nr:hypothetical protein Z043_122557 [Scleropages formosus]